MKGSDCGMDGAQVALEFRRLIWSRELEFVGWGLTVLCAKLDLCIYGDLVGMLRKCVMRMVLYVCILGR